MKLATLSIIPFFVATSQAALVWTVGLPADGWPQDGTGGGANAVFVQEAAVNDLPGAPDNPVVNQQGDDDYYFAGVYSTVMDGGSYTPIGTVAVNEAGAERAFAGIDNSLRYHFNLPNFIGANEPLAVSWDANNLHVDAATHADPRYGVEVYFNGNLVGPQTVIRPDNLSSTASPMINTTPTFTLADVNGQVGEGFDNYVELRGVNYNAEGGGNWMGVDHVSLNTVDAIPEPSTGLLVFFGGLALLPVFRRRRS
ncbi:MAG: hypothetical protein ACI9R3_003858 [Verrucomicrobiales bacterium]|jgi:hypothetical protein